MRDILFRGKLKCDGEWVEGYYLKKEENKHHIADKQEPFYSTPYFYEVIPETVGQFTSLTDKNGKKIFEGDIFRDDDNGENGVVEFLEGEYYVIFGNEKTRGLADIACSCYVIGNIHDNPELLGGEP